MQTRQFETKDEKELLSASAAVLQDLGFQVEESVREVGFLRATKERSAREHGQDISRFFVWLLTLLPLALGQQPPIMIPVDLHQQIAAALVARSLERLRERGMTSAWLFVDADNPTGALGVYGRAGFAVEVRSTAYRKPLVPDR